MGFCVGANGTCIQTTGSTCAPNSTVVNQPCPTSTTLCSTLTNGGANAQINSGCDGQGQCNATAGTAGVVHDVVVNTNHVCCASEGACHREAVCCRGMVTTHPLTLAVCAGFMCTRPGQGQIGTCPLNGASRGLFCDVDPTPGLAGDAITYYGQTNTGTCATDADCAAVAGAGAGYECVTVQGANSCVQVAPLSCFSTLQINGGTGESTPEPLFGTHQ